mgnify:CR=1 FL=1
MRTNPDLKAHVEKQVQSVLADPKSAVREAWIKSSLVENLFVESTFEQFGQNFKFACDEGKWNGGEEKAPTPLRYFLMGVGFCQQVWYAKCAALMDSQLASCEVKVGSVLDTAGELGIAGHDPALEKLNMETRIESDADSDRILEINNMVNHRCPVFTAVRKGIPIYEKLYHNDTLIYEGLAR